MSDEGEMPEDDGAPVSDPLGVAVLTNDELAVEIIKHVNIHGHKHWNILFDALKVRTAAEKRRVWRAIKRVKDGNVHLPSELGVAVRKAKDAARKMHMESVSKALPAGPSPSIMQARGESLAPSIDYMSQVRRVFTDIEMIRNFSIACDQNGVEKVKNPMFFGKAIQLRVQAIDTALKAMQEIWDLRKMQEFYETVIKTIEGVDPPTAHKIMDALVALNNERGFTTDAVPEV